MTDDADILAELRSIRTLLEQIRDQTSPRPRLVSAEQASELLGVPATTVKRVARQTGIHVRLERNRMGFTSEILDELAEAQAIAAANTAAVAEDLEAQEAETVSELPAYDGSDPDADYSGHAVLDEPGRHEA